MNALIRLERQASAVLQRLVQEYEGRGQFEQACKPGTVLVDENTYRSARGLFEWQSLGEIAVKGLEQPLAVYRPLAHSAMPGREQSIEEQDSPLPGIAL